MNSVNFVERPALMAKTQVEDSNTLYFDHAYFAPSAPIEAQRIEVLLVLDARGRIQYGGEGVSCLQSVQHIPARPINSLIPSLPIREGTPGYNIAYVRCAFAECAWQKHVLSTEIQQIPVEIHLRTIPVAGGFCLLGLLRFSISVSHGASLDRGRGS